jgi:hypothetical protein
MTTQKAVITLGCEKTSGDKYANTKGQKTQGRGSRDDGTAKVPDRQLKIRRV